MTNDDTHLLAGAYVCDALSEAERAAFEQHVTRCAACAGELDELRATAALLGTAAAVEPPETLRVRVMRRVAITRQLPPTVDASDSDGAPERRARSRWRVVVPAAAAALLAAVGVLGGITMHQRHEIAAMRQEHGRMMSLLAAADLRTDVGHVGTSGTVAITSSRSRNAMLVTVSGLPALPASESYQLWMSKSGVMFPGPLVRPATHGGTSMVMTHGVDGTSSVCMTVEPAHGSRHPTGRQVFTLALS